MAKFKLKSELVDGDSLLSHIFMNNIHKTKWFENYTKEVKLSSPEKEKSKTVDIKLVVNGEEFPDIKEIFEDFEIQIETLIKKKATELVKEQTSEKFRDICNKLSDFSEITDQWSEDVNWDYDYNSKNFEK